MGHSKLNMLVVVAGFFTLGAAFGAFEPKAEARIEVAPVVIVADPISACTEFEIAAEGLAFCWDNGRYYDLDHYMVESDTDGEGFYLGVWD